MTPQVNITLANGQIGGTIATNDGLTGYVLTGAGAGSVGLLSPVKVISVDDAEAKGLTKANEPEANQFVREFYGYAENLNKPVWLMLAPAAVSLVDLCDVNNKTGVVKLLEAAEGAIRVLGVSRKPAAGYVPAASRFIDSDVIAAVPKAHALATSRFAAHEPLRVIIAARVNDPASAAIDSPNTLTANTVMLAIGGQYNNGFTSMGIFLGQVARAAVHECLGKVKLGDVPVTGWYIGALPTLLNPDKPNDPYYRQLSQLIDAGFATVTTYPNGSAGYYISNDPMCVAETDDYASLARGRTIDKASIIAYKVFCNELNDDVELDDDGQIEPVVLKALETNIVQQLNLNMAASMSGDANVYIDANQNIAQTNSFSLQLGIKPKGYTKVINVKLGYYNPSNANS